MTSKSEIKRLAAQDPIAMAERCRALELRCEAWKALAQGRACLLASHRLAGLRSSEALKDKGFKLIDRARTVLGDETEEVAL